MHRTLPSCAVPHSLSVIEVLFCNVNVVEDLLSLRFICKSYSVLLHVTKTLAAYQIVKAEIYEQLFLDGTSW